ncbi:MAG: hypothetical protein KDD94_13650, partial [Calditrichaeota bacterium]|nr:hypothetical protein [Calditrichota bacterium]
RDFFSQTITIGSRSVTNSLDNPIRIVDFKPGTRLIYHDNEKVHAVYPQRQMSFDKINFTWEFTGDQLIVYPKLNYIKTKPIAAITDKRTWYNNQWEKMYNKRNLFATVKEGVFKWNTDGLNETELDLVNWFKKN